MESVTPTPHSATPDPTHANWVAKVLILAGGPAVGTALGGITAVLPQIEDALATTDHERLAVKLLIGIAGGAMVIGAPLTGFLSDRLGLKRILILNYLLFTLAGTAGMYLDNIYALVVSRFFLGVAASGAVTASIIIINKRLPLKSRPTWLGAYIAAAALSPIILQPAAGLLAELNWHWAFGVYLIGLPLTILSFIFSNASADTLAKDGTDQDQPILNWFPFRFAILGLIMGCIVFLPLIYTPYLLNEMGITSPTMIAMVLVGDTVTCAAMAFMFGLSRRYLSERAAIAIAFAATSVAGIVVALAPTYLAVMAGMAIAGIGVGWFMPSLMSIVGARVKPHQQGRAAGLVKAANYLATPLCVLSSEPLFQIFGARAPIALSSILSLLLLGLVGYQLYLRKRLRLAHPQAKTSVSAEV